AALALVRRQIVLPAHRDQRIQRRVGVAAARIRLHADLERLIDLAEAGSCLVGVRVVAVADEEAVLALDGFARTDKVVARQRGGDDAVHRGSANLVALVPGAVDQKLQRARGLAAGNAESRYDLVLRQAKQFARRRRSAIG